MLVSAKQCCGRCRCAGQASSVWQMNGRVTATSNHSMSCSTLSSVVREHHLQFSGGASPAVWWASHSCIAYQHSNPADMHCLAACCLCCHWPCLWMQAANNGHLQQLAVFGTSMRSLADTQALVAALTAEPAASAAAPAGASNVINRMLDVSSAEQSSSAVAQQGDVLQLAYQRGCVLEVPCPDCAAHGVGVAVHLFRTAQL